MVRVALEMVDRYGYTIDALRNSLQDLLRRGRLRRATARTLADELTDEKIPQLGALPTARELLISFAARVRQLGDVPSMSDPARPADRLPGRARGRPAAQGQEAHGHRPARLV